eukprot:503473-Rhodomonas_salina.4
MMCIVHRCLEICGSTETAAWRYICAKIAILPELTLAKGARVTAPLVTLGSDGTSEVHKKRAWPTKVRRTSAQVGDPTCSTTAAVLSRMSLYQTEAVQQQQY